MGDYQAQLAKDRHDFANIARVKLREVGRRDISSFVNVERVADLLGEWVMRLSDPKSETPVSVRDDALPRLREILPIAHRSDSAPIGLRPHLAAAARKRHRADDPTLKKTYVKPITHRVEVGDEDQDRPAGREPCCGYAGLRSP